MNQKNGHAAAKKQKNRGAVIEDFYKLFIKSRELLRENLTGITEEQRILDFAEFFLIQLMIIWFLQEKGFLNNDSRYLITKFREIRSSDPTGTAYYEFIKDLFIVMQGNPNGDGVYYSDARFGKIVVTGLGPFLDLEYSNIAIKNSVFYEDGATEQLKKVKPNDAVKVPIFNLFESRDWVNGEIDEFVLGAIYEKLMTSADRKISGSYYTSEVITSFISKETIENFLVDKMNELARSKQWAREFGSIDDVFKEENPEAYISLFEELKGIKILDPAVGSAHFLESAIDVLSDLYERIWRRIKVLNIQSNFEIKVADDKGTIQSKRIFDIDEKDVDLFQMDIRFFIILSSNIYGVDLNPMAVNISRARLFLCIARYFNSEKQGYYVRFPNVHFNLKSGNSLLGFTTLPNQELSITQKTKQASLFSSLENKEINKLNKKANSIIEDENILCFIEDLVVKLNICRDFRSKLQKAIDILNPNTQFTITHFKQLLDLKSILTKVLIALLDSEDFGKINALLENIDEIFREKVHQMYEKYHPTKAGFSIREAKPFHWLYEFPDIFLEKNGFDVIIGNPPYVRADSEDAFQKNQRVVLKSLTEEYECLFEKWDLYIAFIERALKHLLRSDGWFSFIVPNAIATVRYAEVIRNFIISNYCIKRLDYFEGFFVFPGVGVIPMILFIKKAKKRNPSSSPYKILHKDSFENEIELDSPPHGGPNQNLFKMESEGILNFNFTDCQPLGEICYINYGLRPCASEKYKGEFESKDVIFNQKKEPCKPFVDGKDSRRYCIKSIRFLEYGTQRVPAKIANKTFPELYEGTKIIKGRMSDAILDRNGFYTSASAIVIKRYCDLQDVENKRIKNLLKDKPRKCNYEYEYLICILNSKFMKHYLNAHRTHKQKNYTYPNDLKRAPIKKWESQALFVKIEHILEFLYANDRLKDAKFFDHLLDLLICELYLYDQLKSDNVYVRSKAKLFDLVEAKIPSFDYSVWNQLYWKSRLNTLDLDQSAKLSTEIEKLSQETKDMVLTISQDRDIEHLRKEISEHLAVKAIISPEIDELIDDVEEENDNDAVNDSESNTVNDGQTDV